MKDRTMIPNTPSLAQWLASADSKQLLRFGNGQSRIQSLGASSTTVENGVATIQAHGVVESVETFCPALITRVGQPSV
jgi:hypothetical protein